LARYFSLTGEAGDAHDASFADFLISRVNIFDAVLAEWAIRG